MNNNLTYEGFQALAREYYTRGGDTVVECWDERDFHEWVEECGPMSHQDALNIFKLYESRWNDIRSTIW